MALMAVMAPTASASRATKARPAATASPSSPTAINRDGELILTLSDGTLLTPGRVVPDVKRK